jgi:hypothetical protein
MRSWGWDINLCGSPFCQKFRSTSTYSGKLIFGRKGRKRAVGVPSIFTKKGKMIIFIDKEAKRYII